jgi:hypothetical protein
LITHTIQFTVYWEIWKESDNCGDVNVACRIILKWALWDVWTGFIWLRIGTTDGNL